MPGFVDSAKGRKRIRRVEGQGIEALPQHEHVCNEIAAAAGYAIGCVVAAETRVRIRRGDAVEGATSCQWLRRVRERAACALGQGPSPTFLLGPVGVKE